MVHATGRPVIRTIAESGGKLGFSRGSIVGRHCQGQYTVTRALGPGLIWGGAGRGFRLGAFGFRLRRIRPAPFLSDCAVARSPTRRRWHVVAWGARTETTTNNAREPCGFEPPRGRGSNSQPAVASELSALGEVRMGIETGYLTRTVKWRSAVMHFPL